MFHVLNPDPGDLDMVIPYVHMTPPELADHTRDYFLNPDHKISYPAKSYAVALIYAELLVKYFGIPRVESLRDPELLYGNDPYYTTYQNNPSVYDLVQQNMQLVDCMRYGLLYEFPQVVTTVAYFKREFFINPNPYFDNANLHK